MPSPRITVLISGRGSNLAAVLAAMRAGTLGGTVTTVISNRADAGGLAIAAADGVATQVVDHRAFASRDAFDAALANAVDATRPDLVVLAGFMRVLGAAFVAALRRPPASTSIRRCCPCIRACTRIGARSRTACACTAAPCIS